MRRAENGNFTVRIPRPLVGGAAQAALAALAALALLAAGARLAAAAEPAGQAPRLATFRLEITPPPGSPLCGGWIKALEAIDDPLLAKGVVVEADNKRSVLCALDWCEVRNGAHRLLREALARAAGTEPARVAVACLHQHNAPIVDVDAQQLIDSQPQPLPLCDVGHFRATLEALAAAARAAIDRLEPFDQVALGQAPAVEVASTRRVKTPQGRILVRYSSCQDPALRAMPEGRIDPLVRTISFLAGGRPLVRLHYYATHPQSYYGDGRATSDFPGLAREEVERREGVPQIYFTGCAGDVTAGKYNDGSHEARLELVHKMVAALWRSIASSQVEEFATLEWRTEAVVLPARTDSPYTADEARRNLSDTSAPAQARLNAALLLAYHGRLAEPIELAMLAVNRARILHLPGEPFVEFQLAAQAAAPAAWVAVAGYGDGGTGYVCTAESYAEGGYEPTASLLGPESESLLKQAMARLLAD